MPNSNLVESDWTYNDFVQIFNQETLDQLTGIFFCGNFGDPIMNNDLIKMCQYITDNKPTMEVRIHTNGGARNSKWWKELRNALPTNHVVIFALDGLEDTHHLYRIGTTYENVTKNATIFIEAGGIAEWVFIKFKHNQHQVEEARNRSKQIGFDRFTVKNSIRFVGEPRFDVFDSEGNTQYYLEPATDTHVVLIDANTIKKFDSLYRNSEIDCYALNNKEIYIDAQRNLFPCCFLASAPYNHTNPTPLITHIRDNILNQYYELEKDLGGLDNMNTLKRSIKDIVNGVEYQTVWDKYWHSEKLITCARVCGKNEVSKPNDQFEQRVSN